MAKRGRPLGVEPTSGFQVDLRSTSLATSFHNYCRTNDLDKKQVAEDAIAAYVSQIEDRSRFAITLAGAVAADFEDFLSAAWGATASDVVADALRAFIPQQLSRNEGVRERYNIIKTERLKRPLAFRQPIS